MTRIISAPGDLKVASSNNVDIRFAGIEVSAEVPPSTAENKNARGIKIYLEGIRSPETQRLDRLHVDEMERWILMRKTHGAQHAGSPPPMPGLLVLNAVTVKIIDDVGTTYRCVAGQVAGTGTEWDGSRTYLPNPPQDTRILTISFTGPEEKVGTSCQVQLK